MQEIASKFRDVTVLVFGDVMLDQFWWGHVDRISPEAPVPIVSFDRKSLVLGGAANVAANISGLGAKAILAGVTGHDSDARDLSKLLDAAGISQDYLVEAKSRPTSVKTRIIANNQQVVRLDKETIDDLPPELEEKVWDVLVKALNSVDIAVISDYAKGAITPALAQKLIDKAKSLDILVLVDPKGKDYSKYKNSNILTPNQKEALDATGYDNSNDKTIVMAGEQLISEFELDHLLITRGENGMALFDAGSTVRFLDTVARKVYDVTGAGDTVIATLAVALGAGLSFVEACKLANEAAGIVVEQVGTTPIEIAKLGII